MFQPVEVHNALLAAGFNVPKTHPLFALDGSPKDPAVEGFEVVHTGGGCEALRCDYGRFYMLLTSDDGSNVPDPEDLQSSLVGVYRRADDEMLADASAAEWQLVIASAISSTHVAPQETALQLALEALTLAVDSGGELDHEIYVEAKQKLEGLVGQVAAFSAKVESAGRSPEGDDYKRLLSILAA